ncbi:MAG: heme ABC transporter permease CcmC [Betaproteobacteria bacterium]|nr:heme ABC transporter permease CcmC [Betaproteobacteria bacterium]
MGTSVYATLGRLASPPVFYRIAEASRIWLIGLFLLLFIPGIYGALIGAPPDYQQGEGYRIIFVHVPAAWMSLFIYVNMAGMAAVSLIWRGKTAAICARASAPAGAAFTALTLATGSIWGKPMWGTWWVWDARLTSELILLFIYLGYMALVASIPDRRTAAAAGAILLLVGLINIPVIHFSVDWWNTLHQPATIAKFGAPSIDKAMLMPLLLMAGSFMVFYLAVMATMAQALLLEQEASSQWAKQAAS